MQNNSAGQQQLLESLMQKLGPEDKKRVKALLSDKAACQRLLNTPEAKELMREFTGGK